MVCGLSLDDAVWDATTFTKNRDRLLDGDIAEALAAIKDEGLLNTQSTISEWVQRNQPAIEAARALKRELK